MNIELMAGHHNYRVRITPYRTMDNRIEGVVLACIDMAAFLDGGDGHRAKQARKSPSRR